METLSRRTLLSSLSPTPQFAPPLSGREIMRRRNFPNLKLLTHEGRTVKFYDDLLKDKLVILNMMYAECTGVCPTVTANLLAAQKMLAERGIPDVFIYSLTIKPTEDTPEKLREYARRHGIDRNWYLLTGRADDLERLRFTLGYRDPKPQRDRADRALHSGMIRFGNEPLSVWASCQGSANPEWIAEEVSFIVPGRARPLT